MNIEKEVAAMKRMSVPDLRRKFAEVTGDETRTNNKAWLIKRIAWRIQANAEGDLSERARKRAAELANDADLRRSPPKSPPPTQQTVDRTKSAKLPIKGDSRLPLPGTIITRDYKGETLQVNVLPNGFEYEGEVYKSLSAVAKVITGTHCNGFHFFRLKNGGGR